MCDQRLTALTERVKEQFPSSLPFTQPLFGLVCVTIMDPGGVEGAGSTC